jgi:hypothetical protein
MQIAIAQDGYAFFGVGASLEAALADANEWTSEPLDPNKVHRLGSSTHNGDMCWVYVSEALADAIKKDGARAYNDVIETSYGYTLEP